MQKVWFLLVEKLFLCYIFLDFCSFPRDIESGILRLANGERGDAGDSETSPRVMGRDDQGQPATPYKDAGWLMGSRKS